MADAAVQASGRRASTTAHLRRRASSRRALRPRRAAARRAATAGERVGHRRSGRSCQSQLEADLVDERVEQRRIGGRGRRPSTVTFAGTTFDAFGSTSIAPDGRHRPLARAVAHVQDEPRGVEERIGARVHRRRAGVVRAALEHLEARAPGRRSRSRHRAARRAARAPAPARCAPRGTRPAARSGACSPSARSPRHGTPRRRAAHRAAAPAASIAATTPSAPSKRPAVGTLSRCEPDQTRAAPRRPKRLPASSRADLETGLAQPARRRARGPRPLRASSRRDAAPIA